MKLIGANNIGRTDRDQARAAMDRIRKHAKKLKLGKFDWNKLKAERDTGRP
jgi:hypothetical protein